MQLLHLRIETEQLTDYMYSLHTPTKKTITRFEVFDYQAYFQSGSLETEDESEDGPVKETERERHNRQVRECDARRKLRQEKEATKLHDELLKHVPEEAFVSLL